MVELGLREGHSTERASARCPSSSRRSSSAVAGRKQNDRLFGGEVLFPTINLGLRDVPRFNQRRNARVRQTVSVLAHAVLQALGFKTPLMAKIRGLII